MNLSNVFVGERLRALRTDAHMSQTALGDILTVDKSTVSGYETGRIAPPLDIVAKAADYFDVSTDYLLGMTDSKFPVKTLNETYCGNSTLGGIFGKMLDLPESSRDAILYLVHNLKSESSKRCD